MNSFDQQLNNLLNETYFGGSPYERQTGIKRQITFEQQEDVPVVGVLTNIDDNALSPKALKLVNLVRKQNSEEPAAKGGMIKGASTGPGSEIRNAFLRSFGNTTVTVYADENNVYHRETNSPPTIIWTAPERIAGEEEQFTDDGLQITAYYYLPSTGQLSVTRDIGNDRYKVMHMQDVQAEGAEDSIPASLPIKKLVGKVTVEVSAKTTNDAREPFITFYDEF